MQMHAGVDIDIHNSFKQEYQLNPEWDESSTTPRGAWKEGSTFDLEEGKLPKASGYVHPAVLSKESSV